MHELPHWPTPAAHLSRQTPDEVMFYFAPMVLNETARRFLDGFPGLVTYAVKANSGSEVLANLVSAGVTAFDVASPKEMMSVRAVSTSAVLHYNNPVRSRDEVATAISLGVDSYSIDCSKELEKLADVPRDREITVRLALPVSGAAYDFGSKFGVGPKEAVTLLGQVRDMGFLPSLAFHPGTQCDDPFAWESYIRIAADVAKAADVKLARLNVGGGFASHRVGDAPDLERIFFGIAQAGATAFDGQCPDLLCEPGRAMVADAFAIGARIKAIRDRGDMFLNDGIYGGLAETRDMVMVDRVQVLAPDGTLREGDPMSYTVFGPTCDSIDKLPEPLHLPQSAREGDYVIFRGLGAYSASLSTQFNGYGLTDPITVAAFD